MSQHSPSLQRLPTTARVAVVSALRRLGFWGTVLLPLTYLPVLVWSPGGDALVTLAGLLCLNLLCLVVGHDYDQY